MINDTALSISQVRVYCYTNIGVRSTSPNRDEKSMAEKYAVNTINVGQRYCNPPRN